MKIRHLGALFVLIAVLGILAACGGDDDEGSPSPTTSATTPSGGAPTATDTPGGPTSIDLGPGVGFGRPPDVEVLDLPEVGAAGIASNPRPVAGADKVLVLDDGLAAFKSRPADETRTGVTDTTIKFGRTAGITGISASVEASIDPVIRALFAAINEAGGIHGRKLELISRDDQFNPNLTVTLERELVENDKVFGMFMSLGESTLAAVEEYDLANEVLSLSRLGPATYPVPPFMTRAFAPHQAVGIAAATALFQLDPNARATFVIHDEGTGRAQGEGIEIAARELGKEDNVDFIYYDLSIVDLTPIAQQIGAQDENYWVITGGIESLALNLLKALKDTVGYKGKVLFTSTALTPAMGDVVDGAYTILLQYDNCAADETTPVCTQIKSFTEERGIPWNPVYVAGLAWASVEVLVRALEVAGPDLTKEGLMEAMWIAMDGHWVCKLCTEDTPYIVTPNDNFYVESILRLVRYDASTGKMEPVEGQGIINTETSFGLGALGNLERFSCQPPSADRPLGTCPWEGTEWDKRP